MRPFYTLNDDDDDNDEDDTNSTIYVLFELLPYKFFYYHVII